MKGKLAEKEAQNAALSRLQKDVTEGTAVTTADDQAMIKELTGAAYAQMKLWLNEKDEKSSKSRKATIKMRPEADASGVVEWVRPHNIMSWRCSTADTRSQAR